jgi:AraC-like DNA-binding protein
MEKKLSFPSAEIVETCLEEKYLKNEVMLEEHCLVRIISGELKTVSSNISTIYGIGDTILFPKRQLSTIIQYPKNGQPYKCILIILKSDRLKDYYSRNDPDNSGARSSVIRSYTDHPLIDGYFASLMSYYEWQSRFSEELLFLKIQEALTILRTIDKSVDSFLADFSEPGKVDLEKYMEENYMFNMPLEKFSYLSGRSMTTFKRDFKNIYGTTPMAWLTERRLKLAHYLLSQKKIRPIEVYRESGFENFSHFSFAFKKQFGYAPKHISNGQQGSHR